jgi:hypothetical protein
MALTDTARIFLEALAQASADDPGHWHSAAELRAEYLEASVWSAADAATVARRLYRRDLVAQRTMHSVPRWMLTPQGRRALADARRRLDLPRLQEAGDPWVIAGRRVESARLALSAALAEFEAAVAAQARLRESAS